MDWSRHVYRKLHVVGCQLPTHFLGPGKLSQDDAVVAPALVANTSRPMAHVRSDQRKPRLETANAAETLILLWGGFHEGDSPENVDIDRVAAGIETDWFAQRNGLSVRWASHL